MRPLSWEYGNYEDSMDNLPERSSHLHWYLEYRPIPPILAQCKVHRWCALFCEGMVLCATCLEYKPPPADIIYSLLYTSYGVYSHFELKTKHYTYIWSTGIIFTFGSQRREGVYAWGGGEGEGLYCTYTCAWISLLSPYIMAPKPLIDIHSTSDVAAKIIVVITNSALDTPIRSALNFPGENLV